MPEGPRVLGRCATCWEAVTIGEMQLKATDATEEYRPATSRKICECVKWKHAAAAGHLNWVRTIDDGSLHREKGGA